MTLTDAFARAAAAERRGDRQGARAIYYDILAAIPEQPGALLAIAGQMRAAHEREAARELIHRAAASAKSMRLATPDIWVELGRVETDARNLVAAAAAYARALAECGTHLPALLGAGDVALATGDFVGAESHFRTALKQADDRAAPWCGLAQALAGTRRFAEASGALQRARSLAPTDSGVFAAAAWIALQASDWRAAEAHCHDGFAVAPHDPTLLRLLGEALKAAGRPADACRAFEAAIAADPDDAPARIGLGATLLDMGRAREAQACLESVIADGATNAEAFANLGLVLLMRDDYERAAEVLERAVEARPGLTPALGDLAMARRYLCDWSRLETIEAQLAAALEDRRADPRLSPFVAFSLPIAPAQALEVARCWSRETLPPIAAPAVVHARGERLRIGYLSRDLRDHATGRLIVGLIEAHDRHRVEVFGFGYGKGCDSLLRRRIVSAFDHWRDLGFAGDNDVAQAIRDARIDVLLECNGHTRGGRLGALAQRPASVQLHYLAYPGTLGYDAIDGIVADDIVAPACEDAFHHERVFRLPRCYLVGDGARALPPKPPRSDHALPEDALVLACLNQTYKLGPQFFAVWMEALRAHRNAVLWLFASHPRVQANLRVAAAERGVAPRRLIFAERLDHSAHVARLRCADLALDTLPVGSHTTGADALWAGVPLLTCRGGRFAGRVGASLVTAAGLSDLVAKDVDEYGGRLHALLARPDELRQCAAHLDRTRAKSPLWDTAAYAADFEALLERAYNETTSSRRFAA